LDCRSDLFLGDPPRDSERRASMRTLKITALVATLVLVLAFPLTARAGGWSTIALDSPPSGIVSGQETTIGFTVRQHGQTPLGGLTPMVKLLHPASGERLSVPAVESGAKGHYAATVVLPRDGTWEWEINAFEGDHPLAPFQVLPVAAGATAMPATERPFDAEWAWAGLLGLALAGLAGAGLAYSRRAVRSA
jgi:hypothetical protein